MVGRRLGGRDALLPHPALSRRERVQPPSPLGGRVGDEGATSAACAPILVIGIGNPSRGDDALGPLCIEQLEALALPGVELLTDFQLQVEYALDLAGRQAVVFVDAAADGAEPFDFRPVEAVADSSHTSHVLSPQAVLAACERVGVTPPSSAWVMAIRGYGFDLGEPLGQGAEGNLAAALAHLSAWLADNGRT